MRSRIGLLVLVMALLLAGSDTAFAHKLRVFATVVGNTIEGRVYFVGGGAAIDVPVTLYDGGGATISTTRTQAPEGTFSLTVALRDTYRVAADAQDGHVAEFVVKQTRFAETMPAAATDNRAPVKMVAAPTANSDMPAPADAAQLVDEAVARQLAPLLDEIDALRETLAIRDMLGTAGIILGIFGFWSLFAARRKRA